MPYRIEDSLRLRREAGIVVAQLNELVDDMMIGRWARITTPNASLYQKEGVARRIGVIRHAVERIFEIFPPERSTVLTRNERMDVQLFLHAFVMNVYGILDNLAWVFVYERELMPAIRDRRNVGLFYPRTQKHLPSGLREYLSAAKLREWFDSYAKSYRDALAHRLPPYVPPFAILDADSARYSELDSAMLTALSRGEVDECGVLEREQRKLTRPADNFLLSFRDEDGQHPLQLHPQLIVDVMTVHEVARRVGDSLRD